MAIIAAALSVPDPRDRPADKQTQADQKHAPLRDEKSDFLSLLKLWRAFSEQRAQLSRAKLRAWCKENFLSYLRLTEWQDVHGQVMEVVKGELALRLNAQPASTNGDPSRAARGPAVAGGAAQGAGRVPRRQRHQARTSIRAPASSRLGRPWIVSAEQVQTTKVYARTVARIDPALGRTGGRASGAPPALRAALGATRGARCGLRARDAVRPHAVERAGACRTSASIRKAARELFIRHALVRMEYDSRAPFLAHNLQAAARTPSTCSRRAARRPARRRGQALRVLRGAQCPRASRPAAFERWRREAERKEPKDACG
jgi:ATP-dependent helicase HrpA